MMIVVCRVNVALSINWMDHLQYRRCYAFSKIVYGFLNIFGLSPLDMIQDRWLTIFFFDGQKTSFEFSTRRVWYLPLRAMGDFLVGI